MLLILMLGAGASQAITLSATTMNFVAINGNNAVVVTSDAVYPYWLVIVQNKAYINTMTSNNPNNAYVPIFPNTYHVVRMANPFNQFRIIGTVSENATIVKYDPAYPVTILGSAGFGSSAIALSSPSITVNGSWNCVKLENGSTSSTINYTTLTLTSNVPIEWIDVDCSSQCYVGFGTTANTSIQRTAGFLGKERVYSTNPTINIPLYLQTLIVTAPYYISYGDRK